MERRRPFNPAVLTVLVRWLPGGDMRGHDGACG